jgi:uncharacterized protein (DUF58 family)
LSLRKSDKITVTPLFSEDFLRRLERLSLAARKSVAGLTQGERRSPRRGQSVEFADFRPYTAGDDIRRIDWNAYARLEKFFIKLFVEEEDLTVHFILDTSRAMRWGEPHKLDYVLHAAGALGYVALCGLDRITALTVGAGYAGRDGVFPPQRGKRQALAYFEYLQAQMNHSVDVAAGADPAKRLRAYAAGVKRPGPLLVLSDLMDDGWQDGLHILSGRGFEISLVHILAPDEAEPPLEGDLKLLDVEGGPAVEITADYDLLSRYRQSLVTWQAGWKDFCQKRGMHYVPLVTTLPLDKLLFAWMRQRGLLR